MHHQMQQPPDLLASVQSKTALVTGSARGIGGATATLLNKHGANVIIADLPFLREAAEQLIKTLDHPEKAIYVPASITEWNQLRNVFKQGIAKFGRIDIVVANAGIMESHTVLDVEVDENGEPLESVEAVKVLDVNLKGTLNTLRLGLHYMSQNTPSPPTEDKGSIVLVSSTSGYFGATGNAAYIASKHGTVGLLRASQAKATSLGIRVNSIAPSYTPTYITAGFGDSASIKEAGLETNTPEMVGSAIVYAAVDPERRGTCCLVAGKFIRELEITQQAFFNEWLGEDMAEAMAKFGQFIKDQGGYKLPPSTKLQ